MSDPISYMPWMVKKDDNMNEKDELAERYFAIIEEIIKEKQ